MMLRSLLVCPACRGPLEWATDSARCKSCGHSFEVRDRIPILLTEEAARDPFKVAQGKEHDKRDAFEVTRPNGAPWMYGWLMEEKFRRATDRINGSIRGATAVSVCGGSGMDAEFLARAGASVISSDISLGAAHRAAERADRLGLEMLSVVADCERLPLVDRGVDLSLVHDGLHHLEDPSTGIAEMTRVADFAVSITEPASALATAIAVKMGFSADVEAGGNRVARLDSAEVVAALRRRGFEPCRVERYAMYYRHKPGGMVRLLSRSHMRRAAAAAFTTANRLGGRAGNKLVVQAMRKQSGQAAPVD